MKLSTRWKRRDESFGNRLWLMKNLDSKIVFFFLTFFPNLSKDIDITTTITLIYILYINLRFTNIKQLTSHNFIIQYFKMYMKCEKKRNKR